MREKQGGVNPFYPDRDSMCIVVKLRSVFQKEKAFQSFVKMQKSLMLVQKD